jgi:2-polyprenyl-6-methoxyphenol hydroxylase-like FAD-dependent oxidoreductase
VRQTRLSCNVVIAGAGIAAAGVAIRLRQLGFRPLILAPYGRSLAGIEAIPHSALCIFDELGMRHVLAEAGASFVEGFENHWFAETPVVREGYWIHVERTRLAELAIKEAVRQGAVLERCRSIPRLALFPRSVSLVHDGKKYEFQAAIDGTGRSAVWSRPIQHLGRQVADIYMSAAEECSGERAKLVRFPDLWAYRLGLGRNTSATIIGTSHVRQVLSAATTRALGLQSSYRYLGRRPSFPQWSKEPVQGRRVAIGDAALAHDPISGLGIRFALTTAIAAAAVLNSWRDSQFEITTRYYRSLIGQSLQRHLQFLYRFRGHSEQLKRKLTLPRFPESVRFSAKVVQAQTQREGYIRDNQVVRLSDGTFARWIGGLDLLEIHKLALTPVRTSELLQKLACTSNGLSHTAMLLDWCLQHKVLSDC